MRKAYAIITALLVMLTTATTGFSQKKRASSPSITRSIIGCTLGQSSIDQIKASVKSQDGEIEEVENVDDSDRTKTFIVNGLTFWGKPRDLIVLTTVDGILSQVNIFIRDEEEANRLKVNLAGKYRSWKDVDSYPYIGVAQDSRTRVIFGYKYKDENNLDFQSAVLIYSDKRLSEKVDQIQNSDL